MHWCIIIYFRRVQFFDQVWILQLNLIGHYWHWKQCSKCLYFPNVYNLWMFYSNLQIWIVRFVMINEFDQMFLQQKIFMINKNVKITFKTFFKCNRKANDYLFKLFVKDSQCLSQHIVPSRRQWWTKHVGIL